MTDDSASSEFAAQIAGLRERPTRLESRWLLGATVAALTGKRSARLRVGRYVLLRELGRGGQGMVWEAEDSRMGRKVALKFVQEEGASTDTRWLRREARAMARVEHDNIAAVFDFGEHDGRPYVVMERLHGQDLRRYALESHSVATLLSVFVAAGRGLAAAHRAGVVHGDFKPANVMVCSNGSVKVLDFGLARWSGQRELAIPVGGTPAYMAPELREGQDPTAWSDQFSFCASLRAVLTAPSISGMSSAIERALTRGLHPRPDARWPTMEALLGALNHRRGRRLAWVAGAGAMLAALGGAAASTPDEPPDCRHAESHRLAVWNRSRGEQLATAFAAATAGLDNPSAGVLTWARTATALDGYGEAWQQDYARHCEAESAPVRACLHDQLRSLDALLTVWRTADARAVELATEAVTALPGPERCSDAPSATASAVDTAVQAELATVNALRQAGQRAEAARRAEPMVRHAAAATPSTHASVLLISGSILLHTDPRRASERLEASMLVASAAGLDRLVAEAAMTLMYVQAAQLRQPIAAERTRRVATAALARFGGDFRIEASLESTRADLAVSLGHTEEAIEILEALHRRLHQGVQTRSISAVFEARVLHNLARARLEHGDAGMVPRAIDELERVVALETAAYGPSHPTFVETYNTLGIAWQHADDWTRAKENWNHALRLATSAIDDNDRILAALLNNLAYASTKTGEFEEATEHLERAYDIRLRTLGREHPDTGMLADNLGGLTHDAGDLQAALRWRSEALRVFEKTLDAEHPWIAQTTLALSATWLEWGDALLESQQSERARDAFGRALSLGPAEVEALARDRLAALPPAAPGTTATDGAEPNPGRGPADDPSTRAQPEDPTR